MMLSDSIENSASTSALIRSDHRRSVVPFLGPAGLRNDVASVRDRATAANVVRH